MIVAVIPVLNPNEDFYQFICDVKKYIEHIIVVDDGSEVPISLKINKVEVLRNDKNKGKGYSLVRAFKHAQENKFTSAITLDGDGQHDPNILNSFLKINNDIDIVIGNRDFRKPMPFHRILSNRITSFLLSLRSKNIILDSQCGYRKYNLDSLKFFTFKETGFHFESEVLIKVLSNGGTIDHIKIPTIYNNSKSYINKYSDTWKFIKLYIKSLFW